MEGLAPWCVAHYLPLCLNLQRWQPQMPGDDDSEEEYPPPLRFESF